MEPGLTITSFASTIVGVIGAFLLPGLGSLVQQHLRQ